MGRYERNAPVISGAEQTILASKRVFVAGCGGLGGYIIEFLSRAGVGHITAADGDVFSDSNLNRQLLATMQTLGRPKPGCAAERIASVNPEVRVTPVCKYITGDNADALIAGHDLIIDALDNGESRLVLAAAARKAGITLVSGAISGWRGRVIVLRPDENADFLWEGAPPATRGNLCFTASCVAAIQSAEAVKVLLNRPEAMRSLLLELDLLSASWDEIELELKHNQHS